MLIVQDLNSHIQLIGKSIIYQSYQHKLISLLNYTNLWKCTQIKFRSPPSYLVEYCNILSSEVSESSTAQKSDYQHHRKISDLRLGLVLDKYFSDTRDPPDLIELTHLLFKATTRTTDSKFINDLIVLCAKYEPWIIHEVLENNYRLLCSIFL